MARMAPSPRSAPRRMWAPLPEKQHDHNNDDRQQEDPGQHLRRPLGAPEVRLGPVARIAALRGLAHPIVVVIPGHESRLPGSLANPAYLSHYGSPWTSASPTQSARSRWPPWRSPCRAPRPLPSRSRCPLASPSRRERHTHEHRAHPRLEGLARGSRGAVAALLGPDGGLARGGADGGGLPLAPRPALALARA